MLQMQCFLAFAYFFSALKGDESSFLSTKPAFVAALPENCNDSCITPTHCARPYGIPERKLSFLALGYRSPFFCLCSSVAENPSHACLRLFHQDLEIASLKKTVSEQEGSIRNLKFSMNQSSDIRVLQLEKQLAEHEGRYQLFLGVAVSGGVLLVLFVFILIGLNCKK